MRSAANSSGTTKAFINIVVLTDSGSPNWPCCDITEDSVILNGSHLSSVGTQVTNYIVLKKTSTAVWTEVSATVARTMIKVMKLTHRRRIPIRIKAETALASVIT